MLKKILYIIFLCLSTPLFAMLKVAVGTAPEKFLVEQIGGKNVEVCCIMPEGKNLHDFSVTPEIMKKVSECQIFFHSGLPFETQIARLLDPAKIDIFDYSMYVDKVNAPNSNLHTAEHDSKFDVHIWFNYINLYKMAVETEKVISRHDGRNAAFYFRNRDILCNKITESQHATQNKLQRFGGRPFLTHHAAFTYFANEFNLRQMPFEYNGREITPKNLAFLTRFAKQYNIKRIFIQSTASENIRRAIRNATGAKLVIIDPAAYNVLATLNKFTAELELSFE
ncbi:MAG: zinc ABC transporter substrate-binding protein [Lentisphaeria bacterium]|nr:zinc ABC transporter substrate-binding protein [Lentisphaeria bacterium]